MYRFLLTPRWLAVNLVVLLLIPVMFELGMWQLHRHEAKVAQNNLINHNSGHTPVPVGDLMTVGRNLPHRDEWRQVTATGHFDTTHELLARQRTQDYGSSDSGDGDGGSSDVGYYVITPLVTADGTALLVNRGWVPAPGGNASISVPAPPAGQVTVVGRARPSETRASSGIRDRPGIPPHQIMRIEASKIAPAMPYPLYGAYVEMVSSTPATAHAPTLMPKPDSVDLGPHLAYAVQWWLFILAMLGLWVRLVRAEKAELEEELARLDTEETQAEPEPLATV